MNGWIEIGDIQIRLDRVSAVDKIYATGDGYDTHAFHIIVDGEVVVPKGPVSFLAQERMRLLQELEKLEWARC